MKLVNSKYPSMVNLKFIWINGTTNEATWNYFQQEKSFSKGNYSILAFTVKVYTDIVPATHVCTVIVILTIMSKWYSSTLGAV